MAPRRSKKWVVRDDTSLLVQMADHVSQRFCKGVVAWKDLRHPNVLPLLGVTMAEYRFVVVTEWMEHGNINEFVREHPDKNRPELVRFLPRLLFSFVSDVAVTAVACRRYQGTDVYACLRNHSRKSPGGAYSNHNILYLAPLFIRS